MTSKIDEWPIKDPHGKFVFSDGFGTGFNITLEYISTPTPRMLIRVIQIENDKVTHRSDYFELQHDQQNNVYSGVKIEMDKVSADPRSPLTFLIKAINKVPDSNGFSHSTTLDVSAALDPEDFDGKLSRLLDSNLIPTGPSSGFIGVTDARQLTSTNKTNYVAADLSWKKPLRIRLYFRASDARLVLTSDTAGIFDQQNNYAHDKIPVPKWGRLMEYQFI